MEHKDSHKTSFVIRLLCLLLAFLMVAGGLYYLIAPFL